MDFGDASLAALIAGVLSIVGGVLLWWLTKYSKAALQHTVVDVSMEAALAAAKAQAEEERAETKRQTERERAEDKERIRELQAQVRELQKQIVSLVKRGQQNDV